MVKIKKAWILYLMVFFLLAGIANATNVGVVVNFPNGTVFRQCVSVSTGATAYTAMKEANIKTTWTGSGVLAFLNCIDGVCGGESFFYNGSWHNDFYWSFWHNNDAGTDFIPAQVGFGAYTVGDTTVIGSTYTQFYPNATPKTKPTWLAHSDVCENKLNVKDIKVYVDGKKESGADENGGDFEVKPQSKVSLKIDVENRYTDDEDIDIENIAISAIIYDIDDGDDLEEEVDEFDLKADEHEVVELEFEIPLEVEEEDFKMELTVEGEDENGLKFKDLIEFTVEVNKEKHQVILNNVNLVPAEVSCEETARLSIQLYNLGTDDEEDSTFSVTNEALGVNFQDTFDLDSDPFDEDAWFKKTYNIEIPDTVAAGTYNLLMSWTYDRGKRTDTEQAPLIIKKCATAPPEEEEEPKEETPPEEEAKEEVEIIRTTYTQPAVVTEAKESFYEKHRYAIWIVGLDIALVIVLILFFAMIKVSRR